MLGTATMVLGRNLAIGYLNPEGMGRHDLRSLGPQVSGI